MLTAKQDNRLTTAENVAAALALDPTAYAQDKALGLITQELQALLSQLRPLRQQGLRSASKGSAKTKGKRREQLATAAAEIAGDLYSYATAKQDRALQTSADYNYSTLFALRATALTDLTQHIYDEAHAHQADLAEYGITPPASRSSWTPSTPSAAPKTPPPANHRRQSRPHCHQEPVQPARHPAPGPPRPQPAQVRPRRPDFYQKVLAARIVVDRPGGHKGGGSESPTKLGYN